jgi:hypothetical protein
MVCSFHCRGLSLPLLSLFPDFFFFFGCYCKENCFLTFFSVCSLLVYRKATDFCKLILFHVTLLKVFMMSRSFLVEIFRSFMYKIMSSANRIF